MKTYYKIPDSILITDYSRIIEWLESLPKTKRGKNPFTFGNVVPGSITFTWRKDATTFALMFGATPVTEEERHYYLKGRFDSVRFR